MPKLPTAVQEAASKAEPSTGFSPVPAGIYRAKCLAMRPAVPQKEDKTKYNAEWDLQIDQQGVRSAKLWHRVSHDPGAAGMMHGAFNAFGLTLDSDSDEFVGDYCLVEVSVEEQTVGKNAGKMVNKVVTLLPLPAGQQPPAGANGNAPATATAAANQDPWS